MTTNPYKLQPATAFWARSVSKDWNPDKLVGTRRLLTKHDKIASLGSCFAANLVPYLVKNGLTYIQEESRHPLFAGAPAENFSYDKFSAAYGNIYTARQFHQLLDRAFGEFHPHEDRWEIDDEIVDPFRPGLRYRARTHQEFDALTTYHLRCVRSVFEKATVVVFTLGLTEAWVSKVDGAVFPACPGTVAGVFDPTKHAFQNFTVAEIVSDLVHVYAKLKTIQPHLRLILTVSPVPLVATATSGHVLTASTYSKSVLRAACGEICRIHPNIVYFPAYEIITGPQAPENYFEPDRRNVSTEGVDAVMRALMSHCDIDRAIVENTKTPTRPNNQMEAAEKLSQFLSQLECEEAAAGL